ncbi:hypothetical protein AB0C10_37010 [Microbispora amethystogenes]
MRGVPLHDDLWAAAKDKAEAEGRTRAGAIRELIRAYVDGRVTLPDRPEE